MPSCPAPPLSRFRSAWRATLLAALVLLTAGCNSALYFRTHYGFKKELSASTATAHFDVRYRPGSKPAAHAKRIAAAAERDLAEICARLEVANDRRFTLYLFEDVVALNKAAGTTHLGGFATGTAAAVAYDDDAYRFHEIVHLVACAKIARYLPLRRAMSTEGLAEALFDPAHAIDVHAVAKYYRGKDRLPRLAEMADGRNFYTWLKQKAGFNGYNVAGSWMRFLLETHGAEKTKRYYAGANPADVFGHPRDTLEAGWHAALDRYTPTPEIAAHIERTDARPLELRTTRVAGESLKAELEVNFGADAPEEFVPRYQWLRNGTEIAGATQPPIALENLTARDSGIYTLMVTPEFAGQRQPAQAMISFILTVLPRPEDSNPGTGD